jgi:hypothetical protein
LIVKVESSVTVTSLVNTYGLPAVVQVVFVVMALATGVAARADCVAPTSRVDAMPMTTAIAMLRRLIRIPS